MRYREAILSPLGYEITYQERRKYRGSSVKRLCIAVRNGVTYFAFRVCPPDTPEHYRRIERIQGSIPHMARIAGTIKDVVWLEKAHGELLWELASPPSPAVVESQLIEFALATKENQLIHGDLRPWNCFFDDKHGVQVIDWWVLSSFVDDLIGDTPRRRDLIEAGKHYARFHPKLVQRGEFTEIDLADARLMGRLLRGEIELSDCLAWRGEYGPLGRFPWLCSA
jgi:hypothetical protein